MKRSIIATVVATIALLATTMVPAAAQSPSGDLPFGNIDRVTAEENMVTVVGWIIDPDTTAPIDVHVYVDDDFAAGVVADRNRPDVAAAYPAYGGEHGFATTVSVSDGTHEICAYGLNVGAGDRNPGACRTVTVGTTGGGSGLDPVGNPTTGPIESAGFPGTGMATFLTDVRVASQDGFDRLVFEFTDGVPEWNVEYVNAPIREQPSGMTIPVAGDAFLSVTMSPASGVDLSGAQPEQIYTGPEEFNVDLPQIEEVRQTEDFENVLSWVAGLDERATFGVAELSDPARLVIDVRYGGGGGDDGGDDGEQAMPPFGNVDRVTATDDGVMIAGWTIDPDTTDPIGVHVYVDDTFVLGRIADRNRPDVADAYPEFGGLHGFGAEIDVAPGTHRVCAYGINVGSPAVNTRLGCRTVTV